MLHFCKDYYYYYYYYKLLLLIITYLIIIINYLLLFFKDYYTKLTIINIIYNKQDYYTIQNSRLYIYVLNKRNNIWIANIWKCEHFY